MYSINKPKVLKCFNKLITFVNKHNNKKLLKNLKHVCGSLNPYAWALTAKKSEQKKNFLAKSQQIFVSVFFKTFFKLLNNSSL